jgi:DegV family protein with EDD domain
VLEVFEDGSEETIFLTVGDGLSGAYQTAMGAKNCLEDGSNIHVINSKTLAGPLRYLAKKAVALKEQGCALQQIIENLQHSIDSSLSFVIPADFEFLKRSGRLTTIAAKVGGVLKLLPILTQTEDKTRIRPITVKRTWKTAVEVIVRQLQAAGVGANHLISICHAGTIERAESVLKQVKEAFFDTETEILELSPALITHGGPGCIVIQAILK